MIGTSKSENDFKFSCAFSELESFDRCVHACVCVCVCVCMHSCIHIHVCLCAHDLIVAHVQWLVTLLGGCKDYLAQLSTNCHIPYCGFVSRGL